jgi:uncharacterized protein
MSATHTRNPAAARPCPICGKPANAKHRPFCSKRCALVDLGRWLDGDYRVSTNEAQVDAPREEEE